MLEDLVPSEQILAINVYDVHDNRRISCYPALFYAVDKCKPADPFLYIHRFVTSPSLFHISLQLPRQQKPGKNLAI
jgi:hypothetical protein